MKIFITGATGFIGSALVEKLLKENHEIYALCRKITDRTPSLPSDVNIIWGDLLDYHHIRKNLRNTNPEILVHLAAQSSVAYSHYHAIENAMTTYIGTINMQKACSSIASLEKFIFAGTSEEYGNQINLPIREEACLYPNQPYAIAKVAADNYLQYCKDAGGFPVVVLRPFNTYGRRRNFSFVTESIVYQMLTEDKVVLGDPTPIRDFLYVEDHVDGYMKAIKMPYYELENVRAINICTGVGTSIKELAEKIAKWTKFEGEIGWNVKSRPTEINSLIGDWGRAFLHLGWRPQFTLDEGLGLTIQKIKEKIENGK